MGSARAKDIMNWFQALQTLGNGINMGMISSVTANKR